MLAAALEVKTKNLSNLALGQSPHGRDHPRLVLRREKKAEEEKRKKEEADKAAATVAEKDKQKQEKEAALARAQAELRQLEQNGAPGDQIAAKQNEVRTLTADLQDADMALVEAVNQAVTALREVANGEFGNATYNAVGAASAISRDVAEASPKRWPRAWSRLSKRIRLPERCGSLAEEAFRGDLGRQVLDPLGHLGETIACTATARIRAANKKPT